jgi:hypothetical protein
LRTRLERRGLAPTASVLGPILRPPGAPSVFPSLVEATLRVAVEQSSSRSSVATAIASLGCLVERTYGLLPALHGRAVMSTLVLCTSMAVVGFGVYRSDGEPEREADPPQATRFPSAVASPLNGITIDGRLDDWPKDLPTYPIRNQLLNNPDYDRKARDSSRGSDAYFTVGYDRQAGLIYLAVVVPDKDVIVHPTDILATDSVEVYVDGTFSHRKIADNWDGKLNASTMPMLQYVGVPGPVSAYADRWKANPSLLYAETLQTATSMKYQRADNVTTYEWAIKAYDRYPDEPTRLHSGKRLGFEVAVVDKDERRRPPAFLTWGSSPTFFKGFDASTLGELVLVDSP